MSATLLKISADAYHADPCETPSLSSSCAKTIITRTALHAYREHPKLGAVKRDASKSMDAGSLIHSLVLDGGIGIQVIEADDYRTNAAKEAREQAHKQGLVPTLRKEMEPAKAAARRVRERLADRGIELDGISAPVIVWEEQSKYGPVKCRAMLDHYWPGAGFLEFKTISAADTPTCERQAFNLGYDIQIAAYTSGIESLEPALVGRVNQLLAFAEVDEPNCVSVFRASEPFLEIGRRRWRKAVEIWAECLNTGIWPEYQSRTAIAYLGVPAWVANRELGYDEE